MCDQVHTNQACSVLFFCCLENTYPGSRSTSTMEVAMRIFLTAVSLAFLLSVGAGVKSARSENATFNLTNSAPYTIHIKLFSQSRHGWQWPSSKRHWILDDAKQHTLTAGNCQPGEKICYGGSYKNEGNYWGVGLDGKSHCAHCCIVCGASHAWNLTGGASDVASRPSSGRIDDGPALVPAND
jgi:hypothetical protein